MTPQKWWSTALLNKRRSWAQWFMSRVYVRRVYAHPDNTREKP